MKRLERVRPVGNSVDNDGGVGGNNDGAAAADDQRGGGGGGIAMMRKGFFDGIRESGRFATVNGIFDESHRDYLRSRLTYKYQ
ncbi:hypothetical protein EAI_13296 [Harpegnathos saltator]|uniref:Uncharacterized protein n=1 Tax=Harpegnathos saltator TaxID=610380 RepID=E2C9X8_HARSA|nr:hypothetical protein EAI_13296 [Harpegnathos saltator]